METSHRTTINLLDFFKTGRLDFVEPGVQKGWILSNFPDPDDLSEQHALSSHVSTWKYGSLALRFDGDILKEIEADTTQPLSGGPSLALDPGIVDHPSPSLADVKAALDEQEISYWESAFADTGTVILKLILSGVELRFKSKTGDLSAPDTLVLSSFVAHEKDENE